MDLPLPHTSGAGDPLVVNQEYLAALSPNEAHDVVPIYHSEHHDVKGTCLHRWPAPGGVRPNKVAITPSLSG